MPIQFTDQIKHLLISPLPEYTSIATWTSMQKENKHSNTVKNKSLVDMVYLVSNPCGSDQARFIDLIVEMNGPFQMFIDKGYMT